jgi:hypothetical protein
VSDTVSEEGEIAKSLSRITGAPFEPHPLHPEDTLNKEKPEWVVSYRDAAYVSKVPYVHRAWKDKIGVHLESTSLGDTIDWIEAVYGEDVAGKSLEVDYSDFESKEFRERFGSEYPRVFQRILSYEEVASKIWKLRRIPVELRKDGSKGIAEFTFVVTLPPGPTVQKDKLEEGVRILREVWEEADEMEHD